MRHPTRIYLECGPGWFSLINEALKKLFKLNPKLQILQIKEKFGGLRLYVSHCSSEMNIVINEAKAKAEKTCELCGAPGDLNNDGRWLSTKCLECRKAR